MLVELFLAYWRADRLEQRNHLRSWLGVLTAEEVRELAAHKALVSTAEQCLLPRSGLTSMVEFTEADIEAARERAAAVFVNDRRARRCGCHLHHNAEAVLAIAKVAA